jgi:hypothetical protein
VAALDQERANVGKHLLRLVKLGSGSPSRLQSLECEIASLPEED